MSCELHRLGIDVLDVFGFPSLRPLRGGTTQFPRSTSLDTESASIQVTIGILYPG